MRKILSSSQAKELDKATISSLGISSYQLMEIAVNKLFEHLKLKLGNLSANNFIVVAGMGNNGGDGLGIARLLKLQNVDVKVWFCNFSDKISEECKENLEKILQISPECVLYLNEENISTLEIPVNTIIIDAIFGTGLSRSVDGKFAEVIRKINSSQAKVFSVDIPSGLFGEDNSTNSGEIVLADYTFTIQDFPLSAMFVENAKFYGEIDIVDIGHCKKCLESLTVDYNYIDEQDVISLLKKRGAFDHKGIFGHALLIAGGKGKAGAAVMASQACLRSGIGLLSIFAPDEICDILQIAVPEAMVELNCNIENQCFNLEKYSAIGVGPGIGTDKSIFPLIKIVVNSHKPTIFDADALNILSENKELYNNLNNCVLTPHPKEFERLFGKFESSISRLKFMSDFSKKHNCCIVLKGGITTISKSTGEIVFYIGKNPAIATGGSGDVLTGVITSLLAQGYSVDNAAIMGVWIHGEAGKLAAKEFGFISTIATDIIQKLPKTFKRIYEKLVM